MSKQRKHLSKEDREKVFAKYGGQCAYCGCKLKSIKAMQVDHFIPFCNGGADEIENYMPACRQCNFYKSTHTLEVFREYLETIPLKLYEQMFIFKLGVKYGFWSRERKPVKFYFEKMDGKGGNCEDNSDNL